MYRLSAIARGCVTGCAAVYGFRPDPGVNPGALAWHDTIAMARKIEFVGNCQTGSLARLYQRFVVPETGDVANFTPAYLQTPVERRQRVAEADVVVLQVLDWVPKIGEIEVKSSLVIPVPLITGIFLWPYGCEPHVRTRETKRGEFWPYPAELGDSFLNRKIMQDATPEDALADYLAADIGKRAERMFEIHLEKQRNRDHLSGFKLARFIEAHFRELQLFDTPNHLSGAFMPELVKPVFRQLGVSDALVGAALAWAARIGATEAPIHPGVASAFGLAYAGPGRRYRYFNEGGVTFEEYVVRYMKYEYNRSLREGIRLAANRDDEAAAATLTEALRLSPRSAAGRRVFAGVLIRLGRFAEAIAVTEELVTLEPDVEAHHKLLRGLRARLAKSEHARHPPVEPSVPTKPRDSSLPAAG